MLTLSKITWKIFFAAAIISCAVVTAFIIHVEANLPSVDMLRDVQLQVPLRVYSADGKLIAEYGEKRRSPLPLSQIPQKLKDAVIATEDRRFYSHPGVDFRGLVRAAVNLVSKGTKEQGGSTITMQVARNFFLTRTKTYTRKINEILLALKIEQELTKDEILELYLNKIYFGKRAYGVGAAAEVYYGTTVDKLNLAQMAMLAGLPQAPSAINPLNSPENAIKRRTHVLDRMLTYGLITKQEYQEAMKQPIATIYHGKTVELQADYIAEMSRQKVIEIFGDAAYAQGYQVITTIDSNLQIAANKAVTKAVLEYDRRHGYRGPVKHLSSGSNYIAALQDMPKVNSLLPAVIIDIPDTITATAILKNGNKISINWSEIANNLQVGDLVYVVSNGKDQWVLSQVPEVEAAFVAMDPNTGAILSLVGGFDYDKSSFNRATQALRQGGSSIKPLIYAAALENNFTAASIINDAPIVHDDPNSDWRPENHTKEFYGPTRLRTAVSKSRNMVSIRLLQTLGISKAIEVLTNLGIDPSSLPRGLSLALGTNNISPLQLTAVYSTFPNGGYKIEPYFVKQILDSQNRVVYTAEPTTVSSIEKPAPRVLSAQTSYIMTSILQDVINTGSGRTALQLGRKDLAGKTGTTNDYVDAWFAGYNRDIVATAWMGYDETKSLKEYAWKSALPMWVYFMEQALKGKPNSSPEQPQGIVTVKIDPITGLLASPEQNDAIYELFTENTAPKTMAKRSTTTAGAQADNHLIESDNLF